MCFPPFLGFAECALAACPYRYEFDLTHYSSFGTLSTHSGGHETSIQLLCKYVLGLVPSFLQVPQNKYS
jgi:hypothetical protein